MIPRARVRAPWWRRAVAFVRARRIRSRCVTCALLPPGTSGHVVAFFHAAHVRADELLDRMRGEVVRVRSETPYR